jgi:NAD(P)-dependent dehydrogenase (short-subunit alcohol dehydrogenase family)
MTQRIAYVTGGMGGIGTSICQRLHKEGFKVVAGCGPNSPRRVKWLEEQKALGYDFIASEGNVGDWESTKAAFDKVKAEVGEIDVLVNNAGAIPPGSLTGVDDATWRRAWDLKVFGFISLCRAVYPAMAARRAGVIVNVIGAAGERFDPNYIVGSAGNASLMAFTRALGKAAPADGIRVVGINPGPIATARLEMLSRKRAEQQLGDAERWRELFAKMPFGRAGAPEEIGNAVAFLASPRSGYTSGTILTIDGGGA